MRMLLWEIHRLRALVLRANDFVRQAKYHGLYRHMDTTTQTLFKGLQDSLKQEPVVAEDEARRMDQREREALGAGLVKRPSMILCS